MRRRKKINETSINSDDFLIPYGIKKSILALCILSLALIISFSIFSYNRSDYTYIQNLKPADFFSLIDRNSDISQSASKIKNWIGLIGAILANFFINDLFGYFSFAFVIILFYWGILILFGINNFRQSLFYSIVIASIGILFSSMVGILANNLDIVSQNKELYGSVGALLGSLLIRLIGSAGGLILIFIMILILSTILLNIDLKELLGNIFLSISQFLKFIWFKIKSTLIKTKGEKETIVKVNKKKDASLPQISEEPKETKIEIVKDKLVIPDSSSVKIDNQKQHKLTAKKKETEDEKTETDIKSEQVSGIQPWDESLQFDLPPLDLLETPVTVHGVRQSELTQKAEMIKKKLQIFKVDIQEIKVTPGPVVTLYEVVPSPNVKVNMITALKDDLALALKAKGIRLIAPMPGRGTIGVEIPNDSPEIVRASSIFGSEKYQKTNYPLPLAMGKTADGDIFIEDLTSMPHLLIAGATGSGKSVGINTIINSFLFKLHPAKVKFVLIDPKRIELAMYKKLKKHYLAVCPDIKEEIITNPENAVTVLKSLEAEMDLRYDWLSKLDVRNIKEFNDKLASGKIKEKDGVEFHPLPYIVVIVDEFADLMITAGKQIEDSIARLAQMSRAAGIHLIFATQRPSVNVIRGNIKANFPARIAYKVSSRADSLTILDQTGAEQLLGSGDMIYNNNDNMIRVQNSYITEQEINRVLDFIENQEGFSSPYLLPSVTNNNRGNRETIGDFDPLIYDAAVLVLRNKIASVTFLQRKLKLGYARAARIMDDLENIGIVGPLDGNKNRLVLVETQDHLDQIFDSYNIPRSSSFNL
ncbi:MAG: DNA translocase FtsK [Ignavibacteria bacterium]|jgi:S-DNA-T family DNA segregation ATPase FtsK/SpoIIIE|nr:DNA translocase FtsK [Ignavibacteria bacterium]MDH7527263.1 DNA translocase FtsK 4TM domain-containing protein [Ignavibacteria bacterium]